MDPMQTQEVSDRPSSGMMCELRLQCDKTDELITDAFRQFKPVLLPKKTAVQTGLDPEKQKLAPSPHMQDLVVLCARLQTINARLTDFSALCDVPGTADVEGNE